MVGFGSTGVQCGEGGYGIESERIEESSDGEPAGLVDSSSNDSEPEGIRSRNSETTTRRLRRRTRRERTSPRSASVEACFDLSQSESSDSQSDESDAAKDQYGSKPTKRADCARDIITSWNIDETAIRIARELRP